MNLLKKINWNRILMGLAIFFLAIGLFILLYSLYKIAFDPNYFVLGGNIDSKTASELGGFLSGFVGIFWTAAGVIFIYSTFNAQKIQNEKQHFEIQFFNMLSTYHAFVAQTKGTVLVKNNKEFKKKGFEGRDYIIAFVQLLKDGINGNDNYSKFENYLKHKWAQSLDFREYVQVDYPTDEVPVYDLLPSFTFEGKLMSEKLVAELYECFYPDYQARIGHLMRLMYNIFKFIIENRQKYGDEKVYIDLIQAQLSSYELALIFYNGLSKYAVSSSGEKKFKTWLENYSFFENIDESVLIQKKHSSFYKKNNYKFIVNK